MKLFIKFRLWLRYRIFHDRNVYETSFSMTRKDSKERVYTYLIDMAYHLNSIGTESGDHNYIYDANTLCLLADYIHKKYKLKSRN